MLVAGQPNQTFTVRARVETTSSNDPGWISVSFYASADTSITSSDAYLGQTSVWLYRGGSGTAVLHGAFPTNVPPPFAGA